MTDKKKNKADKSASSFTSLRGFHMEADRSGRGMLLVLCGIIGISDFSENKVILLSHSGRITVAGGGLGIRVLENNSIEIEGRIEEVTFKYGKN